MLLSGRPLNDVANVNSFEYADVFEMTAGDVASCYFVLIDSTKDTAGNGFVPSGRRYVPASGATLQCTVESIDDDKQIVRYAVQPYSTDGSIWRIDFLASDLLRGTLDVRLRLAEGTVVRTGVMKNILRVQSSTSLF